MIAPLAILALLCAALGWRGERLGEFLGRSWGKILALVVIAGAMSFSIIPGDLVGVAISTVWWFVIAAAIALLSYLTGGMMRLMFRRSK
ncbi:MAG: hypothetical protein R3C30_00215 [Hyphomonadaceae bacterium]